MFERNYFVLSPSFHGATLLAKLVNAHPDVIHLGDTYPSNSFDQSCGCGARVTDCNFWVTIRKRVEAERYTACPAMLPMYPEIVGAGTDRYLYNVLKPAVLRRMIPQEAKANFRSSYETFLGAVYDLQATDQSLVFIDGVKSISRVVAMLACGVRVDGVIHLRRNPGDYTKSSMKNTGKQSFRMLATRALQWRLYHNRAARLRKYVPYLCLNYESLCTHPNSVLQSIFRFVGVSDLTMGALQNRMHKEWHFMGNSALLQFDGTIRRSQYDLGVAEQYLIRLLAGAYE